MVILRHNGDWIDFILFSARSKAFSIGDITLSQSSSVVVTCPQLLQNVILVLFKCVFIDLIVWICPQLLGHLITGFLPFTQRWLYQSTYFLANFFLTLCNFRACSVKLCYFPCSIQQRVGQLCPRAGLSVRKTPRNLVFAQDYQRAFERQWNTNNRSHTI